MLVSLSLLQGHGPDLCLPPLLPLLLLAGQVVPDATTYVHGGSHSDIVRVQIPVMEK
jgi:hypothetical protein